MEYKLYGIKGSGMAALSLIMLDKGYSVRGYDTSNYVYTQDELIKRNIIIEDFDKFNYEQDDVVIYGHSFKESNEIKEVKKIVKEVYEYHEFLNKLIMESKLSIAIAGSHGKTYTTGLISFVLSRLTNASYLIGDGEGKFNGNDIFVFEACEYQDHFLMYKPDITIVLNIDYDHVDYFKSEEQYHESFQKFINQSKYVILNEDDENVKKLVFKNGDYFSLNNINNLKLEKEGYSFNVNKNKINTNIYGIKHISNVLALIKLCDYLNINLKDYQKFINNFSGVKRRFKETIINGDIYIDDYAHHPTQIQYTLEMIKNKYSDYELIVFFKPDRPSRFLTFYKQIATSLEQANYAVIMDFPSCSNKDKKIINLLINLNKSKFYKYNEKIIKKITNIKRKVVVSLSSKNMQEVYEKIFINGHL